MSRILGLFPTFIDQIWLLDAFTIMALGKMTEASRNPQADDEKYKPFPAVKLLYKKLTDRDLK